MFNYRVHIMAVLPVMLLSTQASYAQTGHAHVHGIAELKLVFEGDTVQLNFKSPAANLVGFEYQARTKEEHVKVASVQSAFGTPTKLFSFDGAKCELASMQLDFSSIQPNLAQPDGYDHKHDHKKDHKHKHDHASHSDITTDYTYTCTDLDKITGVGILLFKQFPGIEVVNTQWVKGNIQGARQLLPGKSVLAF